jgi:hypothetical protein
MEVDGPPRMVGWITWSGRERSSQTQFLPVPGVWLIHPIYKSLFRLDLVLQNKDLYHLTVSPRAFTATYRGDVCLIQMEYFNVGAPTI